MCNGAHRACGLDGVADARFYSGERATSRYGDGGGGCGGGRSNGTFIAAMHFLNAASVEASRRARGSLLHARHSSGSMDAAARRLRSRSAAFGRVQTAICGRRVGASAERRPYDVQVRVDVNFLHVSKL